MAAWDAPPGGVATRLGSADQRDPFRLRPDPALLTEHPEQAWTTASHALGRGRMRADQVFVKGGGFTLGLTTGRCDGAELRSRDRVGFGIYVARMRTPLAPGSISALFLYEDVPAGNDEIDIEILNDGSRLMLLTAWVGGSKTRETSVDLPFDPHEGFHDYEIAWTDAGLRLSADGGVLVQWADRYPRAPMRVMANVWWPSWLPCAPLDSHPSLEIAALSRSTASR